MEKLNKDEIFCIAKLCDIKSYINLSMCDKRLYNIFLKSNIFTYFLKKDFNELGTKEDFIIRYKIKKLSKYLEANINIQTENLDINYKLLNFIPDSISLCQNLKRLDFSYNNLTKIPKSIFELTNLTWLELRNNKIKKIPKNISKLQKLEILDLSYNRIKKIPKCIEYLSALKNFYIPHNNIDKVPKLNVQYFNYFKKNKK